MGGEYNELALNRNHNTKTPAIVCNINRFEKSTILAKSMLSHTVKAECTSMAILNTGNAVIA